MAALADKTYPRNELFFVRGAIAMATVIVVGFSMQLAAGRSTFAAPPLVHAHAIVFMGWVVIFVLQNIFVASDRMALHRRLGWIAAAWLVPMLVLGCSATVAMVRRGQVPFVFRPLHFLVFDTVALFAFVGLTTWAILWRRRTDWHRRLHFCGMTMLLMPGIGRALPMPLLMPWSWEAAIAASMIFPMAGVVSDLRRSGKVHPAWRYGIAAMLATFILIEAVTFSPVGDPLYRKVTIGSPGSAVPPLQFAPAPS